MDPSLKGQAKELRISPLKCLEKVKIGNLEFNQKTQQVIVLPSYSRPEVLS